MASGVRLSIFLPAHNAVGTLRRAAESCLGQMPDESELILIDDRSTDGSGALMEEIAAADSRVVVLATEGNGGVVEASARGLEATRGEFVSRMDADDVSLPGRFEAQLKYLAENQHVAVCGCGVAIRCRDGDGKGVELQDGFREYEKWINGLCDPAAVAAERFVESPVVNPSAVMRREAMLDMGGYRETEWAEDYDLWLRFIDAGYAIGKVTDVLFEWWDSPGRLTRTDDRYSQDNFLRAKAHYLARVPRVRDEGVAICGAGPIGKRMGALLPGHGIEVTRFLEVHPRRIGERIGGVPVHGREGMPRPGEAVVIGAVGLRGGRERIRELAREAGFEEGENFYCVA